MRPFAAAARSRRPASSSPPRPAPRLALGGGPQVRRGGHRRRGSHQRAAGGRHRRRARGRARRSLIRDGRIAEVGPASAVRVPAGVRSIDLGGHTVIPGIVGMHDHMFYTAAGGRAVQMSYTGPRLYLGSGVTTIRTTGGRSPYAEINIQGEHRPGARPRPAHPPHRALHHRRRGRRQHGGGELAGGGPPLRRLLGIGGRHLDQGVHRHPPRRAGRGDQGGAQARRQGHRAPLLGQLSGGGRAGHRQPGARNAHRLRLRPGEAARRLSHRPGRGDGAGRPPGTDGEGRDRHAGETRGVHDLHAGGIRAVRRQPADQGRPHLERDGPRAARDLSPDPASDRLHRNGAGAGGRTAEGDGVREGVRRGRWAAGVGCGPDRDRRRAGGIRRPAELRALHRGRLHPRAGGEDHDRERREDPRRGPAAGHGGARQARRPGGAEGRPRRRPGRHPEPDHRLQGWRGLRSREADRLDRGRVGID